MKKFIKEKRDRTDSTTNSTDSVSLFEKSENVNKENVKKRKNNSFINSYKSFYEESSSIVENIIARNDKPITGEEMKIKAINLAQIKRRLMDNKKISEERLISETNSKNKILVNDVDKCVANILGSSILDIDNIPTTGNMIQNSNFYKKAQNNFTEIKSNIYFKSIDGTNNKNEIKLEYLSSSSSKSKSNNYTPCNPQSLCINYSPKLQSYTKAEAELEEYIKIKSDNIIKDNVIKEKDFLINKLAKDNEEVIKNFNLSKQQLAEIVQKYIVMDESYIIEIVRLKSELNNEKELKVKLKEENEYKLEFLGFSSEKIDYFNKLIVDKLDNQIVVSVKNDQSRLDKCKSDQLDHLVDPRIEELADGEDDKHIHIDEFETEAKKCIICLNKQPDIVFLACGHLECCFDCLLLQVSKKDKERLIKTKMKPGEKNLKINCTLCRTENKKITKIFL